MLLGLVGKPSVGKSTFFKAATLGRGWDCVVSFYNNLKRTTGLVMWRLIVLIKINVQCNPNHGFCIEGKRFVPVDLMDVAGLVPGASEGKGLGNQFLDDLRQADAFIHIVDASGTTDVEGKPTENYNPCEDVKFLEDELDTWYFNILKKV